MKITDRWPDLVQEVLQVGILSFLLGTALFALLSLTPFFDLLLAPVYGAACGVGSGVGTLAGGLILPGSRGR